MFFRFLPPPNILEETDKLPYPENGISILELSGVESKEQKGIEVIAPLQAPLQAIGCSPTAIVASGYLGSSGSDYLINLGGCRISQQHPGLENLNECLPTVTDDFCSFVDQNPVLDTASLPVVPCDDLEPHLILAPDSPQSNLNNTSPDNSKAVFGDESVIPSSGTKQLIQNDLPTTIPTETVIIEFAKESQEFLSMKRKIGTDKEVEEEAGKHLEKRVRAISSTDITPLSTTIVSPTPHNCQAAYTEFTPPELETLPHGQETLSYGHHLEMTGGSNFLPLTCENLPTSEVAVVPPAVISTVGARQSADGPIQRYLLSESQDLNHLYGGNSIAEDSVNENRFMEKQEETSEESISDIDEAPPSLNGSVNIANQKKQTVSEKKVTVLSVLNQEPYKSTKATPFSMTSKAASISNSNKRTTALPATVMEQIFSGHSSSTEPDNSNDEDYHPTQVSPKPLLPSPKGADKRTRTPGADHHGKKSTLSSMKKKLSAASSHRSESSELGVLPAKKRVKFANSKQDSKKKILSGLRIIITISSKTSADLSLSCPNWLLDKTKLQKKIKENGGVVINDVWNCFQKDCKKMSKEVVLVTLAPLRTKKFLLALALGIPIISATWVSNCVEQGVYCDYNAFRLSNGDSLLLGQPCAALKAKTGIFEGKSFHIYTGPVSYHDKETKDAFKDWEDILIACDATIVDKTAFKKSRADFVLVLVPILTDKEREFYREWICSTEYVIQCLLHQTMLSRLAHPLFTKSD